jgi:hypothetical protein
MNGSKMDLYWQGKNPKVKAAVMEYIEGKTTQKEMAEKYGVTIVSINNHLRGLAIEGLLNYRELWEKQKDRPTKTPRKRCIVCKETILFPPRYKLVRQERVNEKGIVVGYLCEKCYKTVKKD